MTTHELAVKKGEDTLHLVYNGSELILGDPNDTENHQTLFFCFNTSSPSTASQGRIPNLHILFVEVVGSELVISIARQQNNSKNHVVEKISYWIIDRHDSERWCKTVMDSVYEGIQRQKRLKVLINPFGGQGKAEKIYQTHVRPIFEAAKCTIDVTKTTHHNHAKEIATNLDIEAYDVIVSVSGDGIIHEVINGFLSRPDGYNAVRKIPIGVIPGGTSNALSICLLGEKEGFYNAGLCAVQVLKGREVELDVCSVTYADRRYYSFLSQNYGAGAYADLGTESLRWMGDARVVYGLLSEIFSGRHYDMELWADVVEDNVDSIKRLYKESYTKGPSKQVHDISEFAKDKFPPLSEPVPSHWRHIAAPCTILLASKLPYLERGMLSHPFAIANDGLVDILYVDGSVSRSQSLGIFTKVDSGKHVELPHAQYWKCRGFRLVPKSPQSAHGYISIDGEHAPLSPFQVECHGAAVRCLAFGGRFWDVGVSQW